MKWSKKKAFAYFGDVVARNPVWSWSARSETEQTVVVTLWQDLIEDDGHTVTIDLYGHKDLERWKNLPGNRGRIDDLKWARDHCNGTFRAIMATAKDVRAFPRSSAKWSPDPILVMQLISLDEETGEFRAKGKRA